MRRRCAVAACLLLACASPAFALNPGLDISQYAHTSWKISEGFPEGTIQSIAQTPDGYLWLGTELGLLRFDGVRAVRWVPPAGDHLPSSDVRNLRLARDRRLWIGTYRGLVSWDGAKLTHYPEFDGLIIEALLEDRHQTMWLLAGWTLSAARLCRIQSGKAQCYGQDGGPGAGVTTIYEDSSGRLWAGATTGVWRWNPGTPTLYPIDAPAQRTYALIESEDGGLLVSRRGGLTRLKNGKYEAYPPVVELEFQPRRLLRDRNGGLWVGALTDQGLLHIHEGKTDLFTRARGLSGGTVTAFFEDREGSIWVATDDGLDRFRDFAITTFAVDQGVSSRGVWSILAATDGSVWFGTSDGLNRWSKDQKTVYRARSRRDTNGGFPVAGIREVFSSGLADDETQSLFEDVRGRIWVATLRGTAVLTANRFDAVAGVPAGHVFAIAGDRADNVWLSHDSALLHVLHDRVVDRVPWTTFQRNEPARALLDDVEPGGVWVGFLTGGVVLFKDGEVRASYAGAQGLGEGMVHSFHRDGTGAVWAATEGGLSRIKDGNILTLTTRNGLSCNSVHWMIDDDAGSVWVYTACGLVRIARSDLDAWVSHPKQMLHPTVFDSFDGVRNRSVIGVSSPIAAKSVDGSIWFLGSGGVSLIDPGHLAVNDVPPPVHIEQVTADDKTYDATNGLRLPQHVRNLTINFTALSLAAPSKVHFRYILEGQNRDWHEVVNDRKVQYTNLAPGPYRFRVVASNNSGRWNETGASLDFSIAPAYYQTRRFAAIIFVAIATLLWVSYRLRVAQLARQFNRTLDARVSERTRIARDLHDTLLQSFQGVLLRFQSVQKVLPPQADEARQRLDRALEQAEAAVTEGRNAVHGLRASATTVNDLANGIAAIGAELTNDPAVGAAPVIQVDVDGPSRDLNPVVRDEAYRIAGEALRNAIKHAQARRVIVTIHYEPRQIRLTIHDDGRGIAAEILTRQRVEGHFGLPGMRERAAVVNGRLEVRSVAGAGAQIELRVPGSIAYASTAGPRWWGRLKTFRIN